MSLLEKVPSAWQKFLGKSTLDLLPPEEKLGVFQPEDLFRVMKLLCPEDVRLVFLGMDPYPGRGVPEGLAFSVPPQEPLPASLRNIFAELQSDVGISASSGSLVPWTREGVLLWNTALSVLPGEAGSHLGLWKPFSVRVLSCFVECPFVLLGRQAQEVGREAGARLLVEAPHPSPLSAWRGFRGSRIFSRSNEILLARGQAPISWVLD